MVIEDCGEYCKVTNVNINPNCTFLIDKEDVHLLSGHLWQVNGQYVYCTRKGALHKLIMGASQNEIVDHKSGDTLDNRKSNLRKCTSAQNTQNSRKPAHNTSGYKGVSLMKRDNKWKA